MQILFHCQFAKKIKHPKPYLQHNSLIHSYLVYKTYESIKIYQCTVKKNIKYTVLACMELYYNIMRTQDQTVSLKLNIVTCAFSLKDTSVIK